jgi:hypothetical protein
MDVNKEVSHNVGYDFSGYCFRVFFFHGVTSHLCFMILSYTLLFNHICSII